MRRLLSGTAVDEFPLPSNQNPPDSIVAGPDGNLWFTELYQKIGRITPGGQISEFSILTPQGGVAASPSDIIAGPEGDLWFLDEANNQMDQITPQGQITQLPLPGTRGDVESIAAGADGNLWFSFFPGGLFTTSGELGRITPDGQATLFPLPVGGGAPSSLVPGPGGNIWFLDVPAGKVGSITPSGLITEVVEPAPSEGLAAASDRSLWYLSSQPDGQKSFVKLAPGGQTTTIPSTVASPTSLVAGPDGSITFLVNYLGDSPAIGQITSDGLITSTPLNNGDSVPADLDYGPDGNIWFTENTNDLIGRLDLTTAAPVLPTLVGVGLDPVFPVGADLTQTLATIRFSSGIQVDSTTIDWGDGSATTPGTFSAGSYPPVDGRFYQGPISADHSYSMPGTYHATVTVTGHDSNGKPESLTLPVTVEAVDPTPVPHSVPTLEAAAGITLGGDLIASFLTPTPHDPSGTDFTATIDWGDGSAPSTGTIVNNPLALNSLSPPSNDFFGVLGDHTYASAGDYSIRITISDKDGHSVIALNSADVVSAPFLLASAPIRTTLNPVQDQLTVAQLYDFRGLSPANTYSATIDWGDGSTPSSGSLVVALYSSPPNGQSPTGPTKLIFQYELSGDHVYAQDGTYTVIYTVTDAPGETVRGTTTAQVGLEQLQTAAYSYTNTSVASGDALVGLPIGTILTSDRLEVASDFTATIDWGDGSLLSSASIAPSPSGRYPSEEGIDGFDLIGNHTFDAPGSYQVTVRVTSTDGSTPEFVTTIRAELPEVSAAVPANLSPLIRGIGPGTAADPIALVDFDSRELDASAGDFTATIDWGDGSAIVPGILQVQASSDIGQTEFSVQGGHDYAQAGIYSVSVKLTGADGVAAEVVDTLQVSDDTATTVATVPSVTPYPLPFFQTDLPSGLTTGWSISAHKKATHSAAQLHHSKKSTTTHHSKSTEAVFQQNQRPLVQVTPRQTHRVLNQINGHPVGPRKTLSHL